MNSRIEELLEKYWQAKTSLQEEEELKDLLKSADGFDELNLLFAGLDQAKDEEPERLILPQSKSSKTIRIQWIGWAAVILMSLAGTWMYQENAQSRAEEAAYREVMQALALVQGNLEKGRGQLEPLKELQHLNKPQELFDIDQ
ncbi:hypothetical protein [Algoriphagus sp.]|uniref:hypothetical protein n=1 Tax=Algoriphagus sp. TaxID=1872435 RepID=UPI0026276149|nr:hypothetical protein [Algoriphagus sp.]